MKFKKIILTAILAAAVMAVIFYFSSQTGSESAKTSGGFVDAIIGLLPDFDELSDSEQFQLSEKIHFFVRKTAHFLEYTALGFSLMLHIRAIYEYIQKKPTFAWLIAWGIGVLYAALDEYHQSFTAARSPQVTDAMIDAAGVIAGVMICAAASAIVRKLRKN